MIRNAPERNMARLRGNREVELGMPPASCPYSDGTRRVAWIEGYVQRVFSLVASDSKPAVLLHVKPRGAWSKAEVELLVQAWKRGLPVEVLAALLGRTMAAVSCRATRAELGRRNHEWYRDNWFSKNESDARDRARPKRARPQNGEFSCKKQKRCRRLIPWHRQN